MPLKKFKRGLGFVAVVLALIAVVVYGMVQTNRPLPPRPLPSPNGYDELMRAGKAIVGDPAGFRQLTLDELSALVATNRQTLALFRKGLNRPCRIALDIGSTSMTARMPEIVATKRLAQLILAEGRAAELEHRTNDAAGIYLEVIRFGNKAVRGGVMIDRLVGSACESMGVTSLEKLVNHLDAKSCRHLIRTLDEIEAQREPLTDVLLQEREWMRRNASWRERLQSLIPIARLNPLTPVRQSFTARVRSREYKLTLLMVQIASRAYELEVGKRPKALTDLVPDYLKNHSCRAAGWNKRLPVHVAANGLKARCQKKKPYALTSSLSSPNFRR